MDYRYIVSFLIIFCNSLLFSQSLVLIDNPGALRDNLPVIEVVDDNYILLADKSHLKLLSKNRIQYTTLDNDLEGKDYYLVYPFKDTPDNSVSYSVEIFGKYGNVLASFEKCLLVQSTDLRLHSMTEYSIQLDYVELELMQFDLDNMAPEALVRKEVKYNPIIQEILDRIDPDSVEGLERRLCEFHTRHGRSKTSKNEVMPWFEKIFKEYGCDSVIVLPISGCSPAVAGVRFGTREPSLKKFTLLGGHNDNIIKGGTADQRHQGGNDNTTGTVAVLEACRVHQYYDFEHTIVYCAFNAEELGFKGSNVIMKALSDAGCKAVGGFFSYDMFGMKKNNMKFRAYTGVSGANEFVSLMKQIKQKYGLTQPVTIETTNSGSPPTDSRMIWKYGYQGITHNFAMAGAGKIHTTADVITSSYDKVFQAECAKLGIATTAEQALPSLTNIQTKNIVSKNSKLRWVKSGNKFLFTINSEAKHTSGSLDIYTLSGKLVRSIKHTNATNKILWNGMDTMGRKTAKNTILVINYSSPTINYHGKMVIR